MTHTSQHGISSYYLQRVNFLCYLAKNDRI